MPDQTPNLALPWLMPAQAQKHVTVNEALGRLDALVQTSVESRSVMAEPTAPLEGQAWLMPQGATGPHWAGLDENAIAYFQDGAWHALTARTGQLVHVSEDRPSGGEGGWEKWCPGADSNHRHADFQSAALPTELPGHLGVPGRARCSGRTGVIGRENFTVHALLSDGVRLTTGRLRVTCRSQVQDPWHRCACSHRRSLLRAASPLKI